MAGIMVTGLSQIVSDIQKQVGRLKDRIELHRQIGVDMIKWIDRNFEAQGLEKPWAPLAASTVFGRRQGGGGAKILQNIGTLRASHTYRPSANNVVVGFPEGSIAEYQHFGTAPYTIRPKNPDGVLAFPFPPGLGAKTSIVQRRKGAPKVGTTNKSGNRQSFLFVKEVHHPGLKARPLLPLVPLAEQLANESIQRYMANLTGGK